MSRDHNAPFPIQLEVEFLDRLSEPVREGKARSVSQIIRAALERFNLENVVVVRPSQVLISVRLSQEVRRDLKRVAREKHTSVGQLVRAAVESFLPHLESESAGQLEIAMPTSFAAEPEALAAPTAAPKKKPMRRKRVGRNPAPQRSARAKAPVAKKKKRVR